MKMEKSIQIDSIEEALFRIKYINGQQSNKLIVPLGSNHNKLIDVEIHIRQTGILGEIMISSFHF